MNWDQPNAKLGAAWVALAIAVALHVTDETLTNFLAVYNPSVIAMREKLGWWPMPTFTYGFWLGGLTALVIVLFLLSPFVFRGARWMRPIAYFLVVVMIGNAAGHTAATIFGRTVATVRFPRPAPGFYSSPFLLAASLYLLVQLRKTAKRAQQAAATNA